MIGGFQGIIQFTSIAIISEANPSRKSYYVNLSMVFYGVGALLGPLSASYLLYLGFKWCYLYLLLSVITIVMGILSLFIKDAGFEKSQKIEATEIKSLFCNKKFMLICLCMALYSGSEVGSWGWMSTFLKESLHFGVLESGVSVGIFWASMTVGRLVCGHFADKYSPEFMIRILSFSSMAAVLLSGIFTDAKMVNICITLMGLSFSSIWPSIASYGISMFPSTSGALSSVIIASGSVGSATIPYLLGVIGEKFNVRVAMAAPSVCFFMIFLLITFLSTSKNTQI